MNIENIPQELKDNGFWCLWKREEVNGRMTKIPYNPRTQGKAMSNNKETFNKFDYTCKSLENNPQFNGLGLGVFDGIGAIDIDHCFDENGKMSELATDVINSLDSYTEISPSGEGIRIFLKVENGFNYDRDKYYIHCAKNGLEIYLAGMTNKFLTVTGNYLRGSFVNSQDKLEAVLEKYMHRPNAVDNTDFKKTNIIYSNNDLLTIGLEKDSKLIELYNSTPSGAGGNESETDFALCSKLNYWCDNDENKVYNAFINSPYAQRKDNAHKKKLQRKDYLKNAIRSTFCSKTASQNNEDFKSNKKIDIVKIENKEPIIPPTFKENDFLDGDNAFDWLYQFKDDKFKMAQLLEKIRKNANAVGVKNCVSLWKAYLLSKTDKNYTKQQNAIDFTGQDLDFDCGEYTATDSGITTFDKYGFEILVCNHPVIPIQRLTNIDTRIEKINLAFRKGKNWRETIVDKKTLASSNLIVSLADYGLAVNSENAKHLVKYLTDIEHFNYDKIPEVNSVSRLGWADDYGFSPYVDNLKFDGELSFKSFFESVKEKGDFEEWLKIAKEIRQNGVTARILLASSFASVLVNPCGALPFFVHCWGGTEAGKTVGLMLSASVWANPEMGRYIHTFNSTLVAQELSAGFVNSMPLIIDELQIVKDRKDFDNLIYQLSEGVGRSRGQKTGGLQKLATWQNCIITSGEMPISNSSSGGGAVNRIIEIDCKETKLFKDPVKVAETVKKNYGFAGKMFVEKLKDEYNMAYMLEMQKFFYKQLCENGDSTEKQTLSASIILTADQLIEEWIFQDGNALKLDDIQQFLSTKNEVSPHKRALEFLYDFVAINQSKFNMNNYGEYGNEVWGGQDYEYIYIIKSQFDKIMNNEGYNSTSFLSWANNNNLLETEKMKHTKNKWICGQSCRCVWLKAQKDSQE